MLAIELDDRVARKEREPRVRTDLQEPGQPRGERGRREPPAAPPSSLRAPLARQNALEVPRPAVGFFRPHSGFRGYCRISRPSCT